MHNDTPSGADTLNESDAAALAGRGKTSADATVTNTSDRIDRRDVLKRVGIGAATAGAVLAAPSIISVDAARAATSFATLQGTWLAQHTIAGSCVIPNNPPYIPNGNATSWSQIGLTCGSILIWTMYGIGSNGTGTILSVGDQSFRARWTGCGASSTHNSQAFDGILSLSTYNDVAANGVNWVAVGDIGKIRRSSDDGIVFSGTVAQPGGSPALRFVTHDHGIWITGGSTIGLLWRSSNNGANWTDQSQATSAIFNDACFDPIHNCWIAGGTLGQFWRSNDDGATWFNVATVGINSWASVDASADGTLIAAAAGLGVMARSTDGGVTWATQTIGGGTPAFTRVKAGIDNTRQWMVVGLANQIFWTNDDGITWMGVGGLPSLRTWQDVTVCQVAD